MYEWQESRSEGRHSKNVIEPLDTWCMKILALRKGGRVPQPGLPQFRSPQGCPTDILGPLQLPPSPPVAYLCGRPWAGQSGNGISQQAASPSSPSSPLHHHWSSLTPDLYPLSLPTGTHLSWPGVASWPSLSTPANQSFCHLVDLHSMLLLCRIM